MKHKNVTTHLCIHMGSCFMWLNYRIDTTQKKFQAKKESRKLKVSAFSFYQETSKKNLANIIIIHEYLLCMVEHWAFKRFIRSLIPMFKHITRNTLKSNILKIYDHERDKTISLLAKSE